MVLAKTAFSRGTLIQFRLRKHVNDLSRLANVISRDSIDWPLFHEIVNYITECWRHAWLILVNFNQDVPLHIQCLHGRDSTGEESWWVGMGWRLFFFFPWSGRIWKDFRRCVQVRQKWQRESFDLSTIFTVCLHNSGPYTNPRVFEVLGEHQVLEFKRHLS